MISKESFSIFVGIDTSNKFYDILTKELFNHKLDTKLDTCSFIAEALVESNNFHSLKENLNYNAEGLVKTFPRLFPTIDVANNFAHQPEKIANYVYGGRLGNGVLNGDGYKYIGRGIFQNTGKTQYTLLSKALELDLVNHPELLEIPLNAIKAAIWYWETNNLSHYAELGEFEKISKAINRGNPDSKYPAIGNDERNLNYSRLLKLWV